MKKKTTCFILLAVMTALWITWSFGYQRGYSKGARDEMACWEEVLPADDTDDFPSRWTPRRSDGFITARRKIGLYPGGKPLPEPRARIADRGAKNVVTSFFISQ